MIWIIITTFSFIMFLFNVYKSLKIMNKKIDIYSDMSSIQSKKISKLELEILILKKQKKE